MKSSNYYFVTVICVILTCIAFLKYHGTSTELEFYKDQYAIIQQQLHRLDGLRNNHFDVNVSLPVIFAVTPTYSRLVQKAELTRISQTLQLVPNVHWILVEDSETRTRLVQNVISKSGLKVTHLNAKTDLNSKKGKKQHRGVEQRNVGLKWLRDNFSIGQCKGVVYFMDDDNVYDVRIFKEMSKIRTIGVWPVGLAGNHNLETPILDRKTGEVKKFFAWRNDRPFPIDMAGFAITLDTILGKKDAYFTQESERGYLESDFLGRVVKSREELEPLAYNCTRVHVWHTRTEKVEIEMEIPGFEV